MQQNSLILGAGAVGLGIGSCIASSTDWPLSFLTRPGGSACLAENGIRRSGIFGECSVAPDRIFAADQPEKLSTGPYDLILVCTKSFDAEGAALAIAAGGGLLGAASKIVLFHNGWGSAEQFAAHFPRRQIFNARVITGFRRPERWSVDVTVHADDIRIGSIFYPDSSAEMAPLAQAINDGGIPAQVSERVGCDLWAKMLYNCALNPLGAMLDATYGALGDSPDSRSVMDRIIDEAFLVMQSSGHSTHWETADGFREAFYSSMIPPTYVHESSMLQDIRAGRKTEIDYLSGAIVRLGKGRNISTPANQTVYNQIKYIEAAAGRKI